MKRFLLRLLALLLAAGLILVAAGPTAIRQYRLWRDGQIAAAYLDAVAALSPLDCGTMLAQAKRYDAARGGARWTDPFDPGAGEAPDETYQALLNPTGNGVMAVLEIPKLGATQPVYHGTRDAALGAGVGHLAGSSLPVGAGGQCVLAALRGGWLAGPFHGLERLIPGDSFTLRTLQDTMLYEVTRTAVVEGEALAREAAGDGEDECLLVTPVTDGRRLLVRANRVARRSAHPSDDTRTVPHWGARLVFALPVALAGLIALALAEGIRRCVQRRRRRRMKL